MLPRSNSCSGQGIHWLALGVGVTLACFNSMAHAAIKSVGSVNPVPPAAGGTFSGQLVVGDAQATNKDNRALVRIDSGSVLQYGSLIIGDEGDLDDPDVYFGEINVIGNFPGTLNDPFTALNLSGGGSTSAPTVQVGRDGFGALNLSGGAAMSLTSSSSVFSIGVRATGVGSVSLTDPFTIINAKGDMIVGQDGVGELQIREGASVVATGTSTAKISVGPLGRIELENGTLIGTNLSNGFGTTVNGYLGGSGLVRSSVDFRDVSTVGVGPGDVLRFDGRVDNRGSITIQGGELRSLSDFSNKPRTADNNGNTVTPPGRITLQDGTIRFSKPLTNDGVITSAVAADNENGEVTTNHIHGRITNASTGTVLIASDTVAIFHDSVTFGGKILLQPRASAHFLADLNFRTNVTDPPVTLDLVAGGPAQVTAVGAMTLGGDLNVSLDSGYTPAVGDRFELLSAGGGITGTFNSVTLPDIPGNLEFGLFHTPTSVVMAAQIEQNTISLPGDYDRNGVVDAADYVVWRDRLGDTASLANDDTLGVGQDDYDRWRANFGAVGEIITGAALGALPAVPEPSGAMLSLVAAITCALSRHRLRESAKPPACRQ